MNTPRIKATKLPNSFKMQTHLQKVGLFFVALKYENLYLEKILAKGGGFSMMIWQFGQLAQR